MQVITIIVSLLQILFIKTAIGFTCEETSSSCNSQDTIDYYWRDYNGFIPGDAVPGGSTYDGSTTYIGQAYIRGRELLPVTIYRGCTNARGSASNTELQPNKNIKILCCNDISKFSWIRTTVDTTRSRYCDFPLGGSEINDVLHIGRIHHNGEVIIGKIFGPPVGHKGLWIPNESGHETNFHSYEILAYNCTR